MQLGYLSYCVKSGLNTRFKNNLPHSGAATLRFANGNEYFGQFDEGKTNGAAQFRFAELFWSCAYPISGTGRIRIFYVCGQDDVSWSLLRKWVSSKLD